jgi:hypothetical protein
MHTKFWFENLKVMDPLGRLTHRWEDNITMNLGEIRWKYVDWIHVAQDRDH